MYKHASPQACGGCLAQTRPPPRSNRTEVWSCSLRRRHRSREAGRKEGAIGGWQVRAADASQTKPSAAHIVGFDDELIVGRGEEGYVGNSRSTLSDETEEDSLGLQRSLGGGHVDSRCQCQVLGRSGGTQTPSKVLRGVVSCKDSLRLEVGEGIGGFLGIQHGAPWVWKVCVYSAFVTRRFGPVSSASETVPLFSLSTVARSDSRRHERMP
jgi:hypothetical protein